MEGKMEALQELLRSVTKLVDPVSKDDKLKWLMDPKIKGELFEAYPKCILPVKNLTSGNFQPFFFICNRRGMTDPDMINFSITLCAKLEKLTHIDQEHLRMIKKKLMMLKSRYDKPIPKPFSAAAQKGRSTMKLNKLMKALHRIRNNGENN